MNGSGHVGNAVVNDPAGHVGRIRVGSGTNRFAASALVDRDVDDHRADHDICVEDRPLQVDEIRVERVDVDIIEVGQAALVDVQDTHLGSQVVGHAYRRRADNAAPDHGDPAARDAGDAAQQHSAPALIGLQVAPADLDRAPVRDFAHGYQQGQRAVLELHGLEPNRDDPGIQDPAGSSRVPAPGVRSRRAPGPVAAPRPPRQAVPSL